MKTSRAAHWAADLIDVAAVFFAVGTAHLFVTLLGERADGAVMLIASGAVLIAGADAVAAGGGEQTETARADAHDLVDPATRALTIARHAATGATSLDEALYRLLDAELTGALPPGVRHVAALHAAGGEPMFLGRQSPAFTPTEIARAQSLVDLCAATLHA